MTVLDTLGPIPNGWKVSPLGGITTRKKASGTPHLQPLSVFLGDGVVPRSDRDDNHNQLGGDLNKYLTVAPGDLVFNKLRTWQGGFGVSSHAGIVSPAYYVLRPGPVVIPRYLHHLLRSSVYLAELKRLSKWMPPSQFDIGWSELKNLPLLLPPLIEQRQIADFLDDQVKRIDQAIVLRGRQVDELNARNDGLFDSLLVEHGVSLPPSLISTSQAVPLPDGWAIVRLAQLLDQLTNGYVGPTRDILVDDGVRYIQGLHIKRGQIDFDRRHFFVTPEWHRDRPRINLRHGDVLIVQTGDLGQVAVVPRNFGEASCHALLIARVRNAIVSPDYLASYLRSSFGRNALLSRATGALHPHLEGGIRSVPVAIPSLTKQAEIVQSVEGNARETKAGIEAIHSSVKLLRERKQALLTACVTGEFDVSSASNRAADAVIG